MSGTFLTTLLAFCVLSSALQGQVAYRNSFVIDKSDSVPQGSEFLTGNSSQYGIAEIWKKNGVSTLYFSKDDGDPTVVLSDDDPILGKSRFAISINGRLNVSKIFVADQLYFTSICDEKYVLSLSYDCQFWRVDKNAQKVFEIGTTIDGFRRISQFTTTTIKDDKIYSYISVVNPSGVTLLNDLGIYEVSNNFSLRIKSNDFELLSWVHPIGVDDQKRIYFQHTKTDRDGQRRTYLSRSNGDGGQFETIAENSGVMQDLSSGELYLNEVRLTPPYNWKWSRLRDRKVIVPLNPLNHYLFGRIFYEDPRLANQMIIWPMRTQGSSTNKTFGFAFTDPISLNLYDSFYPEDTVLNQKIERIHPFVMPTNGYVRVVQLKENGSPERILHFHPVMFTKPAEVAGERTMLTGFNLNFPGTALEVFVNGVSLSQGEILERKTLSDRQHQIVVQTPSSGGQVSFEVQLRHSTGIVRSINSAPADLGPLKVSLPKIAAVQSVASSGDKMVSPGKMVTLWGNDFCSLGTTIPIPVHLWDGKLPLPFELGGCRVKVGGKVAPLYFAFTRGDPNDPPSKEGRTSQINLVVPQDITSGNGQIDFLVEKLKPVSMPDGSTKYEIESQSVVFWAETVPVAPSFFAPIGTDGLPTYPISLQKENGTWVSGGNPATKETLVAFFTGGGKTDPQIPDGKAGTAKITAPCSVSVGALPAEVVYCGNQGQYPGLQQLNFRLPEEVKPDASGLLKITFSIGSKSQSFRVNFNEE